MENGNDILEVDLKRKNNLMIMKSFKSSSKLHEIYFGNSSKNKFIFHSNSYLTKIKGRKDDVIVNLTKFLYKYFYCYFIIIKYKSITIY